MTENTISDSVRSEIQKKYEENPEFFLEKKNRTNFVKELKSKFPNEKPQSIQSLFSSENPKIAKAYNVNPDAVKSIPKPKFSSELKTNIKEKKADLPKVQNPHLIPQAQEQQTPENQAIPNPYNITDTQISALADSVFNLVQAFDSDIEDLTETEKSDLGYLWTPLAQTRITGERSLALLALGGTVGIMGRKVKDARRKRKEKKEKEEPKPTPVPNTKLDEPVKELFQNG